MKSIKWAYAWFWYHATLRGPGFLWNGPYGGWSRLALYSFQWAGYWAYKDDLIEDPW